ncbi:SpoIIE family protein phosphatase, partial [Streptomyces sp. NPDC002133]|uniref:SpoIIE family protein phosphatase n=1 Tax=Streptomyces sp. NPDC002133 TaxID=3154409 RepID=UPI00332D7258
SATTLPIGFGGEMPRIREHTLQQGDRVLCYTDGIIEEHVGDGEQFGEERLIRCVNRLGEEPSQGLRADLRRLSHTLKRERSGRTSDDATLFMSGAEAPPTTSRSLTERPRVGPDHVVGDKGYSSKAICTWLRCRNFPPPSRNEPARPPTGPIARQPGWPPAPSTPRDEEAFHAR